MENTSLTRSRTITIIGIVLIMVSSYLFFVFYTSLSIYFVTLKEVPTFLGHISYPENMPIDMKEMKGHLLKEASINFILGTLFLTSGIGFLYLKRQALKIIFVMGIIIIIFQGFTLLSNLLRFGSCDFFNNRVIQILFFVLILIVLSIKKIRALFV